jgi:hypothetical protein
MWLDINSGMMGQASSLPNHKRPGCGSLASPSENVRLDIGRLEAPKADRGLLKHILRLELPGVGLISAVSPSACNPWLESGAKIAYLVHSTVASCGRCHESPWLADLYRLTPGRGRPEGSRCYNPRRVWLEPYKQSHISWQLCTKRPVSRLSPGFHEWWVVITCGVQILVIYWRYRIRPLPLRKYAVCLPGFWARRSSGC